MVVTRLSRALVSAFFTRPPAVRLLALGLLAGATAAQEAGTPGGPGLAIRCAKALVCPPDITAEQVVDQAWVLVRDGKIEAVEPARAGFSVPAGYEVLDVEDAWCMPGMIELHSHEGGTYDINDTVYLANPGMRAYTAVRPANDRLERGVAAGITSQLFIPGSGANIGGWGVLFKSGVEHFEDALIRNPGALKLAQWGNPESWTIGVGMAFENWNTRNTFRRGLAYAAAWEAFEAGQGPEPDRNVSFDIFRELRAGRTQVATHTQVYQVVLMTITMIKGEFGLDVFLDHSTIGGWLTGALAQAMGVSAIVGPRSIDPAWRGMIEWAHTGYEGTRGVAAGYQERGLQNVGFNTDAPVLPQDHLPLQAGMAAHYGFRDEQLQTVRGLTVVPAMTVGLEGRLGSLLPGRDADILVITGHPADPRSWVRMAFVNGQRAVDSEEQRLW